MKLIFYICSGILINIFFAATSRCRLWFETTQVIQIMFFLAIRPGPGSFFSGPNLLADAHFFLIKPYNFFRIVLTYFLTRIGIFLKNPGSGYGKWSSGLNENFLACLLWHSRRIMVPSIFWFVISNSSHIRVIFGADHEAGIHFMISYHLPLL